MTPTEHDLSPDQIIDICEYVTAVDDIDQQAQRRERMAEKYEVTEIQIRAIVSNETIRLRNASREILRGNRRKNRSLRLADEDGLPLLERRGMDAEGMGRLLKKRGRELEQSLDALATLQEGDVRNAIEQFAQAGDFDALAVIVEVYTEKRPDIAAEALCAAGKPDEALVMALKSDNRRVVNKILAAMAEYE